MKVKFNPVANFLHRADAERASDLLKSAGIDSMVRDANDCPEGYRVLTRQPGFTLWVLRSDQDKAIKVLNSAQPPPLLCQVCGTARATEHVTVIRKHRETKHFCTDCYAATSIT